MTRCFQPLYRSDYGVTRAQWRKLSTFEKLKLIREYRDRQNSYWFAMELSATEPTGWAMPFPPDYRSELLSDPDVPF